MKYRDFVLIPVLTILGIWCFYSSITDVSENHSQRIHFLIPGGAGGGWDTTARGIGEALQRSSLAVPVSFENMSGGGGGKAIAHLIETADRQQNTLLVNSVPIVIRSLQGVFPQSFHDLTPVASVIGDYSAFVVRADSPFRNWQQVIEKFHQSPTYTKVAGGSIHGSMDHLVAALAFRASKCDPKKLIYVPYDAGGKAMAGLLAQEAEILCTGLGEALEMSNAGQIRILIITAPTRLKNLPEIPTLKELGYDMSFVNWRGFFAAPRVAKHKVQRFNELLQEMYNTPEWQTVCQRNGWIEMYIPGQESFARFLQDQEQQLRSLMIELGFLEK